MPRKHPQRHKVMGGGALHALSTCPQVFPSALMGHHDSSKKLSQWKALGLRSVGAAHAGQKHMENGSRQRIIAAQHMDLRNE